MIESKAHPLARQCPSDMNAQLLVSGRGLRHARAGFVESDARGLEFVARPKLLVCHVG